MSKNVYIIAGPNGAGKTTFAEKFLPRYARCQHFINSDLIAQGLSPFSPQIAAMRAGRLVLEQIKNFSGKGEDFAFETTLSGRSYVRLFRELKRKGFCLHLFFLWIPSVELALARIKERVAEGGHNVPAPDVRRRFHRGIRNLFTLYKPLLDSWTLFDNAGSAPKLIAEEKGEKLSVIDQEVYDQISGGHS